MQLIHPSDPILTTLCESFNFFNPPIDPLLLAHELVRCMYENNGLGLAANQVGKSYRVFAMRGSPENFVCFNPKIIDVSNEQIILEEGCLTYPNLLVKIKRPKNIKVRFNTPNSDIRTEVFHGISARIFQHEMDHLDGLIFYNRASKYHRDLAFRKFKIVAQQKSKKEHFIA